MIHIEQIYIYICTCIFSTRNEREGVAQAPRPRCKKLKKTEARPERKKMQEKIVRS